MLWRTLCLFAKKVPKFNTYRVPVIRGYLTSAFSCEESWNKRLESPYLKRINVSDMFYQIENQFLHFGKANALDIDLFANAIADDAHLDEVEDVIHKLRLSPGAADFFPSSQHAFIRAMFSHGDINELLRILDDRLNYGVFMDDYCCILLLNKFLKEKDYTNAARISSIHMLQEDFSHPIIKYMSLFACHNYVLNPIAWDYKKPEELIEKKDNFDDDDEIRVRVRYIRNEYFDDHFDLRNPNLLVGKTLWMIGNEMPDSIGRSSSMVGYAMHQKWEILKQFIRSLLQLKEQQVIYKDIISVTRDLVQKPKENTEQHSEDPTSLKQEILTLLDQLENSNSVFGEDLLKDIDSNMKTAIKELEVSSLNNQIQIYKTWEKKREELIQEHLDIVKRDKMSTEIKTAKQKLKEQEEELFFFENEDKLDVIIENKRVRYPKKWLGKKKQKRTIDTEYVPPEMPKRREY